MSSIQGDFTSSSTERGEPHQNQKLTPTGSLFDSSVLMLACVCVVFIVPNTTLKPLSSTPPPPKPELLCLPANSQPTHALGRRCFDIASACNAGSLLKAWQGSTPDQKTALVTELSQTLLGISRDEAQSLPLKDLPALSLYEKVFSLMHHHKRQWEHLSSRNSTKARTDTAASKAIGSINAEAASTEDMA